VKRPRLAQGLSQLDLSAEVDSSQSQISTIERGTSEPPGDLIASISDRLDIENPRASL
jgi:transcriptional regulator with XRE-family HTH domain